MTRGRREKYERSFIVLARAVAVGFAYVIASPIPGLTSSFVAIFASLLPFDLMVAAARPLVSLHQWKQSAAVLGPRLRSTTVTLLKGVVVGAAFGLLAALGLPDLLGAVLTTGLAYVWAMRTPHVISAYVAMMSGLSLYDSLVQLEHLETTAIAGEIAVKVLLSSGGTFLGLGLGWSVGILVGSVTRLFLSRPYRSLQSQAYDPPMTKKPFDQVLPIGGQNALISGVVEPEAPVAYRSLAECRFREQWRATVLSVRRGQDEVVMPPGSFVLLPGDELLVLTDGAAVEVVHGQLRSAPAAEVPGEPPAARSG